MSQIGDFPQVYSNLFKTPGTMSRSDFQKAQNMVTYQIIQSTPKRKKSKLPLVLAAVTVAGTILALPKIAKAGRIRMPEGVTELKNCEKLGEKARFIFAKTAAKVETFEKQAAELSRRAINTVKYYFSKEFWDKVKADSAQRAAEKAKGVIG